MTPAERAVTRLAGYTVLYLLAVLLERVVITNLEPTPAPVAGFWPEPEAGPETEAEARAAARARLCLCAHCQAGPA